MAKSKVEEVLQQGIHGKKEIKPEERKKFLGTIRERILIALTKSQVRERGVHPEVIRLMKEYPDAHLFTNGTMSYGEFSKYLKKAAENKIAYTIVANKEHETEIGLVLACEYAVDRENIYVGKANTGNSGNGGKKGSGKEKAIKRANGNPKNAEQTDRKKSDSLDKAKSKAGFLKRLGRWLSK